MATFTKKQMETLSKYEGNMETAVKADWCRAMGRTDLQTIHAIYVERTGSNMRLNTNCATCTLQLLKEVGSLYFSQKEKGKGKPAKLSSRQVKRS